MRILVTGDNNNKIRKGENNMTLIKTTDGAFALQSFALTINNQSKQVTLTLNANYVNQFIKLQAPLADTPKAEFLKHFFAYVSRFAEVDSKLIDIREPLKLAKKMGFKQGFTPLTNTSTLTDTLKTRTSKPIEGVMLRLDLGKNNNEVLTRQYVHLASDNFSVQSEMKPSSEGAKVYFYIKGNKALAPYFEVYLTQALKTNRSINLYTQKLEQALIEMSKQQHYIDLLQAVNLTPPTFRHATDYSIGVTEIPQ